MHIYIYIYLAAPCGPRHRCCFNWVAVIAAIKTDICIYIYIYIYTRNMCIYIYIYHICLCIHICIRCILYMYICNLQIRTCRRTDRPRDIADIRACMQSNSDRLLLSAIRWHYLSNATGLIRPHLFSAALLIQYR